MDSPQPPQSTGNLFSSFRVKLYRFRTVLRRYWWVLFLTISAGLAYQAWSVFKKPDLYESTSQLNIAEELNMDEIRKFRSNEGSFVGDTLTILRSPVILERARARLLLEAPDLVAQPPEITTSPIPRTSIFLVTGVGTQPEYTQRFVDAVVKEYAAFREEQRDKTVTNTSTGLQDSISRYREELNEQKAKLESFVRENNMPFWAEQGRQSAEFLSDLKTREAQLKTELQRLENLTPDQLLTAPPDAAAAQSADQNEAPSAAGDRTSIGSELYGQYLQTFQQLIQRRAELAERSRVWKPKHPRLQAIKDDVVRLERLIEVIKEQNNNATSARSIAIRAELKSLATSIEEWNAKVMEANSKDAAYQTLQGDVTRTQNLLEKLLTSAENVSTARTVVDPLMVLQRASAPALVPRQTTRNMISGGLAGLLIGLIILVLIDRADDRLTSSSEVLQQFTEPIIGQIPDVGDSRR
ncbi:MAG: GumC family protein, partial [Chthoniobacteraceae bacterium]